MIGTLPWAVWGIAALATSGMIARPFHWPDWVWPVAGAALLVLLGLLSPAEAWAGMARATDVCLFLTGMMLLSELARLEGLFDWLAAHAAAHARGSGARLFSLIFAVGTLVTIFLSNDATAVVLTPAVAAVVKTAKVPAPRAYLLICAFVTNAASFVLPISNPANLVVAGSHLPPLLQWLPRYALPSILAIAATYLVLRWTQRQSLRAPVATDIEPPGLSPAGKLAALGLGLTALVMLTASWLGIDLGWPTFLAGVATACLVLTRATCGPVTIVREIAWGVLPLVAGLFVLVQALEQSGATASLARSLHELALRSAPLAGWASGLAVAIGCNLVNNLPAGLVAGRVADAAAVPDQVRAAILIGVDLGPNLSVTGSLATLLWLSALRRAGHSVGAWQFFKLGAQIMPASLALALAATLLSS